MLYSNLGNKRPYSSKTVRALLYLVQFYPLPPRPPRELPPLDAPPEDLLPLDELLPTEPELLVGEDVLTEDDDLLGVVVLED